VNEPTPRERALRRAVLEFVAREEGVVVALLRDEQFAQRLGRVLLTEVMLPRDRLLRVADPPDFFRLVRAPQMAGRKVLLVVERALDGRSAGEFVSQAKALLENMLVIVVTSRVDREMLVLLHEHGVANFITLPATDKGVLEKIADTVRPRGKIGRFLDQGRTFIAQRRYEEALSVSAKVLEISPESAAGLLIRGDSQKGLGRRREAAESYLAAAERAATFIEPLKRLADLHREEGDVDGLLAVLQKLDRISPLNYRRTIEMGAIHLAGGFRDKAAELFDRAVDQATAEAMSLIEEVRLGIAEKCLERDPAMAEAFFRAVLGTRRDGFGLRDVDVFNRLGIALRRQGKWREAVAEYEKALRVAPEDGNLHFNLAVALYEGGRHPQASAALDRALALAGDLALATEGLALQAGVILLAAGRREDSLPFFRRVLELNPNHEAAARVVGTGSGA